MGLETLRKKEKKIPKIRNEVRKKGSGPIRIVRDTVPTVQSINDEN